MNAEENTREETKPDAQATPPPASSSSGDPRVPLQHGERSGVPGAMGEGRLPVVRRDERPVSGQRSSGDEAGKSC